jgi:hypothetical protein
MAPIDLPLRHPHTRLSPHPRPRTRHQVRRPWPRRHAPLRTLAAGGLDVVSQRLRGADAPRGSAYDPPAGWGSLGLGFTEPDLNCPRCGGPIAHPGYGRDGSTAMAECLRCDILFDPSDYARPRP